MRGVDESRTEGRKPWRTPEVTFSMPLARARAGHNETDDFDAKGVHGPS
tara:strand:+ start:1857 stop:2003 length:147 start_codon:yes stop_codon:yes gene_type:complete